MSDLSQYRGKRTRNKHKYLRKRRRRVFLWIAAVLLLVAAAAAGVFSMYGFDINKLPFMTKTNKGQALVQPKQRVTTLVVIVRDNDVGEELAGIVLTNYNPSTRKFDAISIPVSTMADVPGYGVSDVKQAYAQGKVALTKATIEYLAGVKIGHYIKVNEKGLTKIIDAAGGVTINGKNANGKTALESMAAKNAEEKELARLERQNYLVLAIQKKANSQSTYDILDKIIGNIKGSYDSDFSTKETPNLAKVVAVLKPADVKAQTLPVKEVVVNQKTYFQPETTAVTALMERVFPELKKAAKDTGVKVRVLNGVGEPGIASDMAKKLTDSGYRVVDTKNADTFGYAETQIIIYSNKADKTAAAEKLKTLLGVGKVVINNLPQDVADITVIIGQDYADKARAYELLKKVEVLNGTSRAGFAGTIADKLTTAGYQVANTGNADRFDYATTQIIVYVDNPQVRQMANDLKALLGAGEIKTEANARIDIEISIILGKDL
jgi:polyisoprenyl-teichoic acid--peptidoglycan teichoic acid transferase